MEHPTRVEEFVPSEAPGLRDVAVPALAPSPAPAAPPLPPLPSLPASDVLFLRPSDAHYADYLLAANARRQLSPALRAVCKTEHAVSVMVDWVRSNNLSFAVRCGGHSYEGFSQSRNVVIDLRGLNPPPAIDKTAGTVTVGAGADLFQIYQALAAKGLALQAGSCPTVGISGHILGGGHGLLARSHGLTCDSLRQLTLVDAQAHVLQVNATTNADLFWACRGGGGGSFGVATQFVLNVFPLASALVFGVQWTLSQANAARMFAAWQTWAPNATSNISSIMKVGPAGNSQIMLRCIGQSVGTLAELRSNLANLTNLYTPSKPLAIQSLGFLDAVRHFAGTLAYQSVLFKAKSDYVLSPLGPPAIQAMMAAVAALPAGAIALLCDAYGGKIADVAADATAFPHRAGTQYCIQYYTEWAHAGDTPAHLANIAKVYAAMRPYMPGASYVNYCDLDLPNYADAYWGANLARLSAIKKACDPANLFHHAQSVPVGA